MAWHFSLSGVTFFSQWRDTFLKSKLKVYATNENNLVTSYNIRTSLWDVCVNSLSDFLMNHEYHRYFKDLTFLPRHLTAFGSLYKWQSCVSLQKSDCLLIRENHRYFDDWDLMISAEVIQNSNMIGTSQKSDWLLIRENHTS